MSLQDRSIYYMSPPMRFLLLLVVTGISLILGGVVAFSIVASYLHISFDELQFALNAPENARISLIANTTASFIAFLLPSLAVAYFSKGPIAQRMGFNPIKSQKLIFWVILLAIVGLLLSGSMATLNEKIPIPASFKIWATALEEKYKQTVFAMTKMNSFGDLLFNLFAIALIPAFVEELYFRGAVQTTLKKISGKSIIAIIITAIIFSGFHFSYYGFLSRMSLGIVLGLVYEYTESIWLPMLLHFINNGIAIVTLYLLRGDQHKAAKAMDDSLPIYWGMVAIGLVTFLLIQIKRDANYERLDKNLFE